jgi:hypothetical protein
VICYRMDLVGCEFLGGCELVGYFGFFYEWGLIMLHDSNDETVLTDERNGFELRLTNSIVKPWMIGMNPQKTMIVHKQLCYHRTCQRTPYCPSST